MDLALRVFRHNQYQELIPASDVDENDLTDLVCKYVVAGSLLEAKSQGVERAVLFTSHKNYAAQAAYRGIGFQATGEKFGLVLFQDTI